MRQVQGQPVTIVRFVGKERIRKKSLKKLKQQGWREFAPSLNKAVLLRINEHQKQVFQVKEFYPDTECILIARRKNVAYLAFQGKNAHRAARHIGEQLTKLAGGHYLTTRWIPKQKFDMVWKEETVELQKTTYGIEEKPAFKIKGQKEPKREKANLSDVERGAGRTPVEL